MHYETTSTILYHRTLLGNALTVNHWLTGRSGRQTKIQCKGLLLFTAILAASINQQGPVNVLPLLQFGKDSIFWSLEVQEWSAVIHMNLSKQTNLLSE